MSDWISDWNLRGYHPDLVGREVGRLRAVAGSDRNWDVDYRGGAADVHSGRRRATYLGQTFTRDGKDLPNSSRLRINLRRSNHRGGVGGFGGAGRELLVSEGPTVRKGNVIQWFIGSLSH